MLGAQLYALKTSLFDERQAALKAHVDAALSIVKGLADDAEAGRLTVGEAQARAKYVLRKIRYGAGDYFFAYDYDGNNVVHGLQPQNEGKNFIGNKDPDGKLFTAEQIKVAKEGGGIVEYRFRPPG